jgi:hypothetical protein
MDEEKATEMIGSGRYLESQVWLHDEGVCYAQPRTAHHEKRD